MITLHLGRRGFGIVAAIAMLAGCSQGSLPYMQSGAPLRALDATGAGKIKHVVYIVQENRSFDNLFQGYPGADTVSSGKNSNGKTIALQPVSLATQYDDRSLGAGDVRRVQRNRQAARHEVPHGRLRQRAARTAARTRIRSTSTCRTASRSRTSTWRTNGCWPTACSSRSSTRASSRINTSSPRRRPASVDLPYGAWGCGGGTSDYGRDDHARSATYGPAIRAVLRLSDARRRARRGRALVALLRQHVRQRVERRRRATGRAIRPSGTSTTGPTGRKTSSRRTGSSSPTCARASSRTSRGSRRSATTPIT